MKHKMVMTDGNEATAHVAYRLNEVIAIYPITPSSAWANTRSVDGGTYPEHMGHDPSVVQMQSEGGAAGAVHGALQTGALSTTFTASQGLLLMIPNMYKIAGELTSRSSTSPRVPWQRRLSPSLRPPGCDGLPPDRLDALQRFRAGSARLRPDQHRRHPALARAIPALFDGFRTSHEVNKIERIADEELRAMIDDELIIGPQPRPLTPTRRFTRHCPEPGCVLPGARDCEQILRRLYRIVETGNGKVQQLTGRAYHIMEYSGAPDAERVMIIRLRRADLSETAELLAKQGEKVGVIYVRLYRPFSIKHLMAALPATVKKIAK